MEPETSVGPGGEAATGGLSLRSEEPVPSPSAPAPRVPPEAGRRAAALLRPVVIYLASRAVTWGTLAVCAAVTHRSLADEVDRWDSRWFLRAAVSGWPARLPYRHGHVAGNTIAFFPMFPLAIRWLSHLTGLSPLAAGLIVTSVTGLSATVGVWLAVRHYADRRAADRATLLVAMFPGALVLSLVYSDGIVVTCMAFGVLALMTRRWLLAGVLGMFATGTSPIALAFEVSCLWCAYHALAERRDWRVLAAPVLTPIGFVAYQLWLWAHTGNLLAWRLTEQGGWKSYPSIAFPVHIIVTVLRDPVAANKTEDLLFVGTVFAVVGSVAAIRQRMPMPMLLYGISAALCAVMATPDGLRPRFLYLAFPLIVAVGIWLRGKAYVSVLSISIVALIALTAFEVCTWQVFP
jgi:hypothetical protein